MPSRRALLVGASAYGEGFHDLNAVVRDLVVVEDALKARHFEVQIVEPNVSANATILDQCIRDFCRNGNSEDIRLVYFTGHGITVDGDDCIVPAKTSRQAAFESPTQRVSTDLTTTVLSSDVGLVLFLIDACREPYDSRQVKSTSTGWGDASHLTNPNVPKFVRLFGCGPDNVCHILNPHSEDKSVSVFSQALANVLERTDQSYSIRSLHENLESECKKLALGAQPQLTIQVPRLSHGEITSGLDEALNRCLFEIRASAYQDCETSQAGWTEYDADRLHCLVVHSESDLTSRGALDGFVRGAFTGSCADEIWQHFRAYWQENQILDNGRDQTGFRSIPDQLSHSSLAMASIPIEDVFPTWDRLEDVVRLVVESDLAIFDVTGFEPGVMFLMGIRAATSRGVTIASHGGGWREGTPLPRPFNLTDLSFNCHTPTEHVVDIDPAEIRLGLRIRTGFAQLCRQPSYLDFPVFDALRRLGPDYQASSIIAGKELLLVLCSYSDAYQENWVELKKSLRNQYFARNLTPNIWRLQDIATPQLVSQALYELVRRASHCLVDWTNYSPSAFLELGVRLAVSPWGAVQIAEKESLPLGDMAPRRWRHSNVPPETPMPVLEQITGMVKLLNPTSYQLSTVETIVTNVVGDLVSSTRNPEFNAIERPNDTRLNKCVRRTLERVHVRNRPIEIELERQADAFHQPAKEDENVPQILFHQVLGIKYDFEQSALARRLAAWLYLEHRVGAGSLPPEDPQYQRWLRLGRSVQSVLWTSENDDDVDLALTIEQRIGQ